MVLDRLENAVRYLGLHPSFPAAFAFLQQSDLASLPLGRRELDGHRLYANVECVEGRGREGAKLEAHRRYIDIQLSLEAPDLIGWRGLASCETVEQAYDGARECEVFGDEPEAWIALPSGTFAVFFPEDAHAPLAAEGPLRKVVVKVRM